MRYFIILSILISLFLCSLNNVFGSAEGSKERLLHEQYTHTVDLRSLLPATTCNPSTKGNKRKTSLELVHKHGPCSHLPQHKATATNHTQILEQDQARVNLINSRISKKLNGNDDLGQSEATTLPSRWATSRGAGNYIVTVGLGTPNKQLSLEFDTGSFLTWTQCQPCVSYCYPQNDPIFDPAASTSYAKISCNSAECAQLRRSQCSSAANTCLYQVIYGDKSHTIGFFSKDKLTLTPDDVFDGFLFGCGQENVGFQDGSAGLLGLSRDKYSIVEQTAVKYDRSFSYCLPPTASSTGYLTFGSPTGASNAAIKYTRLTTLSSSSTYYGLNLVGINVNGQKLSIPASEFSSPGTIIDSGTVISRLSPTAFSALRDAFQVAMESYPSVPGDGFLDTCYDLSGYPTVTYPKIEFVFGDGVTLTLDATGIVYLADGTMKQVCLAFVGNDDADKVTIFGNTQQKNMEVLYDVAGERVGFAPGGCGRCMNNEYASKL